MGNKVLEPKEIIKEIIHKIHNSSIPDSEIIQYIERVRHKDPEFDINLKYEDNGIADLSLLMKAVYNGRKELARYLLTIPGININHKSRINNNTALNFICSKEPSLLKLLLSHRDLDVNVQSMLGHTVLHYACDNNDIGIVKELLLDARIDVSIRNILGSTARNGAIAYGHFGIVNILKKVQYTPLLRIQNNLKVIVKRIIEEYV